MREILFKAKRIDNGDWVDGYYIVIDNKNCICFSLHTDVTGKLCYHAYFEIDPNTLCQYTGLLDKNGNKIFENDILQREDGATYWCFYNSNKGLFNLYAYEDDPFDTWERWEVSINDFLRGGLEIIGNIHDKERTQ